MTTDNTPLVSIAMLTYNHENFITDSIESALAQITDFEFEIIIGDDCSTDNTSQICKNFAKLDPKIQLVENIENIGLIKNYQKIFSLCRGQYIAILEGDDFWIDNSKLQKQINIIRSNKNVGIIHTNYNILTEKNQKTRFSISSKTDYILDGKDLFNKMFLGNFICAGTVLFEKKILHQNVSFTELIDLNVPTIDAFLWIELSRSCDLGYLSDPTLTYRVHKDALSNSSSFDKNIDFISRANNGLLYFYRKYKPTGIDENTIKCRAIRKKIGIAIKHNKRFEATAFFHELIQVEKSKKKFLFVFKNRFFFLIIKYIISTRKI
jgi:glycosyltransferase involved in cell wall biosynthesis